MKKYVVILLSCTCASAVTFAQDDDAVVSLSATVTGNQEQPKVLYVVPWKQTKDNSILAHGLESRLQDVFDHVEPNEHRRGLTYLETLADGKPEDQEN